MASPFPQARLLQSLARAPSSLLYLPLHRGGQRDQAQYNKQAEVAARGKCPPTSQLHPMPHRSLVPVPGPGLDSASLGLKGSAA